MLLGQRGTGAEEFWKNSTSVGENGISHTRFLSKLPEGGGANYSNFRAKVGKRAMKKKRTMESTHAMDQQTQTKRTEKRPKPLKT